VWGNDRPDNTRPQCQRDTHAGRGDALAGELATITRALLIALFLLLTTPVAAHVIAQAAYLTGEARQTPGAFDETAELRPTP